jgi:hypothetical protein
LKNETTVAIGIALTLVIYAGFFLFFLLPMSLFSYPTQFNNDLIFGFILSIDLSFFVVFGISKLSYSSETSQEHRRASWTAFLVMLVLTLAFVPLIPSDQQFTRQCAQPPAYWKPQIEIAGLSSFTYALFGSGVIYRAYYTAYSMPNQWPIDGYLLMANNHSVISSFIPPVNLCFPYNSTDYASNTRTGY